MKRPALSELEQLFVQEARTLERMHRLGLDPASPLFYAVKEYVEVREAISAVKFQARIEEVAPSAAGDAAKGW